MKMKEKNLKETSNKKASKSAGQKNENTPIKRVIDRQQKDAAAGEIQSAHTVGRHGTDDEKDLNPEE